MPRQDLTEPPKPAFSNAVFTAAGSISLSFSTLSVAVLLAKSIDASRTPGTDSSALLARGGQPVGHVIPVIDTFTVFKSASSAGALVSVTPSSLTALADSLPPSSAGLSPLLHPTTRQHPRTAAAANRKNRLDLIEDLPRLGPVMHRTMEQNKNNDSSRATRSPVASFEIGHDTLRPPVYTTAPGKGTATGLRSVSWLTEHSPRRRCARGTRGTPTPAVRPGRCASVPGGVDAGLSEHTGVGEYNQSGPCGTFDRHMS